MLWQSLSSYLWDQSSTEDASNHRVNVSLTEEDDWILVVKKENKDLEEVSNEDQLVKNRKEKESGWLLTPPPCFDGHVMEELSVSPFEDLLIEHPSMSIYRRIDSSASIRNNLDHDFAASLANSGDNNTHEDTHEQSRSRSIELYMDRELNKKSDRFNYIRKARDLNVKRSLTFSKANSRSYSNSWSRRHCFTNFSYRR
ncbi:Tumor protein p53-inducible nuclear protein 1 [Trichoplax sp. H2]|uniref:Uncharacterized protein n=1 Tax=Trichoplax adhaerens TaxID=10228 RepID=B3RV77_TRIAD|nr:predicted protein [Trichoplax adhaerens]EDV25946.1 predicted protein [Trichoplax adhaerens]RDD44166.1 Tumor protein p53-inducible nuclear protein 1 [Trichoplax sp. H2]|eukprot:XP_002111979.1 predicted protein [Trichoplax adhaerens]